MDSLVIKQKSRPQLVSLYQLGTPGGSTSLIADRIKKKEKERVLKAMYACMYTSVLLDGKGSQLEHARASFMPPAL